MAEAEEEAQRYIARCDVLGQTATPHMKAAAAEIASDLIYSSYGAVNKCHDILTR